MRRLKRQRRLTIGIVGAILAVPLIAAAQRGMPFRFGRFAQAANVPYDGRFTFARIQYARYGGWAADYPTMERNLTTILHEISTSCAPMSTAATSTRSTIPSC